MRLAVIPSVPTQGRDITPPCFRAVASATTYEARKGCYNYTGYDFDFHIGPNSGPSLLTEAAWPLTAVFKRDLRGEA